MQRGIGIGFAEFFIVFGLGLMTVNAAVPGLGDFIMGRSLNAAMHVSHPQSSTKDVEKAPIAHAGTRPSPSPRP